MAAQQALMAAQKDNGINMLSSIGCLPMLIQWPFFIALYNAAAYTTGNFKFNILWDSFRTSKCGLGYYLWGALLHPNLDFNFVNDP